jgi:Tol biopolymer transport system component
VLKVTIAATAVLVAAVATGAGASTPSVAGRIVFSANDAVAVTGHIYVAQPGKGPVDLSRSSGGFDSDPAVSSDGKHVAFVSTRTGRAAIYTMSIDGTHVARVSPFFAVTASIQIAWEPGAQTFAVGLQPPTAQFGRIYLGTLGGGWRALVSATNGGLAGWSPDGKVLAYVDLGGPVGVNVRGRRVFDLPGGSLAWSATGRFAVQTSNVTVYSEAGKQLATIGGATAFAWSPDGARLATLTAGGILQVRTGGIGRPVSSRKLAGRDFFELQWLGETHVRVNGGDGWLSVDMRTGKEFVLPAAFSTFGGILNADGTEAAAVTVSAGRASVLVGTLKTSRAVASYPECGDDPMHDGTGIDGLQLIEGGWLVYESDCTIPSASIYAVAPDGSHLTRLTDMPGDDEQVAVSPDASTVAFVRASAAVCHDGCLETIWVMSADGSGARSIVTPSYELPYDDSPSFSPDGTQILFARSGAESTELETVPTAGGDPHDLGVSGWWPAWGPTQIAYDDGSTDAATAANRDGSSPHMVVAPTNGFADVPAWSDDGRLALLEQRGSTLSILDVSTGRRVTLAGFEPRPLGRPGLAWSPDGTRFAFTAATPTDPYGDVWTIGVDGTGLTQVTHGLGAVSSLAWR